MIENRSQRTRRLSETVLSGLGGLLLTLYFFVPLKSVTDVSLDPSNYASYAYFTAHGFQFGPDITSMAGPLGFVHYGWVYSGELFWTRFCLGLLSSAILATLTLWFYRKLRPSPWRHVWLLAHIAFTPFSEDLHTEWGLLLSGLFLLRDDPRPAGYWRNLLCVAGAVFLTLGKGSHLILGIATLGTVIGGWAWRRDWRQACILSATGACALLAIWIVAGQNPLNLPEFLRGVAELASGYNRAMFLYEPDPLFWRGIVVCAGLASSLAILLLNVRRSPLALAGALLVTGHSFVQWKHGFVRADGHLYIFFNYAIAAAPAIAGLTGCWPGAWLLRLLATAPVLVTIGATLQPSVPNAPSPSRAPWTIHDRFTTNLAQIVHLSGQKANFENQLEWQRRRYDLPRTRRAVGSERIDFFGIEHGIIALNRLNYHPRPMGGGTFNVYTPMLARKNGEFTADPSRRPSYFLVKAQPLDTRLAGMDDALTLRAILHGYRPVLAELGHLLFRSNPSAGEAPAPRLLLARTAQFKDIVDVPPTGPDEMLLASFEIEPNLAGRIREFLYKPPEVYLTLFGEGFAPHNRHRVIPGLASEPAILGPVIDSNLDLLDVYAAGEGRIPRQIRLATTDRAFFSAAVRITFYAVPRPEPLDRALVQSFRSIIGTPTTDVTTVESRTGKALRLEGYLMHAPRQFEYILDGTEKSISLGYGYLPAAYAEGNNPDGAEMRVQIRRGDILVGEVLRASLDPVRRPTDRGHHFARLPLDLARPGDRLVLVSDPGPNNDAGWDWTYFSSVDFEPKP